METLLTFIPFLFLGAFIGIAAGMLGIGGGTIMVPAFRLAFGMSAITSTATSLFTIIPTSVSGAISHARNKTCIPKLGVAIGIGGACTSPLGVYLTSLSPDWLVMLVAAIIIANSAINMFKKAIKMPKPGDAAPGDSASSARSAAPEVSSTFPPAPPELSNKQFVLGVAIGLATGLVSGYVGVGGAFIMVPLMISLVGISMKYASGTSLIAIMIFSIPGAIEQGLLGNIDYVAGIVVAIGSIPGAIVGARLIRYIPERTLRLAFGGFLIVAAVLLVLREWSAL